MTELVRTLPCRGLSIISHAPESILLVEDESHVLYAFIQKVRDREAADRHIPAIALTAYARTEDRMRALSAGYNMHVPKPVEPAELALVISNLTKKPR